MGCPRTRIPGLATVTATSRATGLLPKFVGVCRHFQRSSTLRLFLLLLKVMKLTAAAYVGLPITKGLVHMFSLLPLLKCFHSVSNSFVSTNSLLRRSFHSRFITPVRPGRNLKKKRPRLREALSSGIILSML